MIRSLAAILLAVHVLPAADAAPAAVAELSAGIAATARALGLDGTVAVSYRYEEILSDVAAGPDRAVVRTPVRRTLGRAVLQPPRFRVEAIRSEIGKGDKVLSQEIFAFDGERQQALDLSSGTLRYARTAVLIRREIDAVPTAQAFLPYLGATLIDDVPAEALPRSFLATIADPATLLAVGWSVEESTPRRAVVRFDPRARASSALGDTRAIVERDADGLPTRIERRSRKHIPQAFFDILRAEYWPGDDGKPAPKPYPTYDYGGERTVATFTYAARTLETPAGKRIIRIPTAVTVEEDQVVSTADAAFAERLDRIPATIRPRPGTWVIPGSVRAFTISDGEVREQVDEEFTIDGSLATSVVDQDKRDRAEAAAVPQP